MRELAFAGKRVVVIGMGMSGRSAAEFLIAHGALVHGVDRDPHLLSTHPEIHTLQQRGLTIQFEKDCQDLTLFDLVVLSPGVPLQHPLVQLAQRLALPIIGEIELGCQFAQNPMIGITGTNGKTTVTLLITHVLKHCGQLAHALGNVEIPFTRELLNLPPSDSIILELSSYQLETLHQPCLESALLLNITPDHLERHGTMEAYAQAKCRIERCLKAQGHLYMEEKAWQQYGSLCREKIPRLYGYHPTSFIYTDLQAVFCQGNKVFELPLVLRNKKTHDLENLLAAYAICANRGISAAHFLEAWQSFKKPLHRIEFVTAYQGITYYDDSKGTNVDAVSRAVQLLEGPIILIAGGVDKGSTYAPWLEEFKNKVKSICAIGQAAAKIQTQLAGHFPVIIFSSLEEAVHYAAQEAEQGDKVLLSPGCASFDMFKDYAHRGREFQRIVHELKILDKCEQEDVV